MFDKAGKNNAIAMLAPVGLIFGLTLGTAHAAAHGDRFVTSGFGEGVKTGYGECWNAVGGTGTPDCGVMEAPAEPVDGDADGDGVPDSRDNCPNTPRGAAVNPDGCPRDSDGDGVPDYKDNCPGTPRGAQVDPRGCEITTGAVMIDTTLDRFDFDSANLKPGMESELDGIAAKVRGGSQTIEVVGHTDSTGAEAYNQGLSERRAQAAADYLAGQGVDPANMTITGMGESAPVADNATRDGRALNRRVEVKNQ